VYTRRAADVDGRHLRSVNSSFNIGRLRGGQSVWRPAYFGLDSTDLPTFTYANTEHLMNVKWPRDKDYCNQFFHNN